MTVESLREVNQIRTRITNDATGMDLIVRTGGEELPDGPETSRSHSQDSAREETAEKTCTDPGERTRHGPVEGRLPHQLQEAEDRLQG